MQIKQKLSPNYTAGRKNKWIIAIVNHITAGLMPGTLSWLMNPAAMASAHYLVTKSGEIYQLVADENTAWHAGAVHNPSWSLYDGTNPNRYTIGIEHECISGGELTEAQYQATLWLHQQLVQKYSISIDTDHIIGHYRIDSVNRPNDPGSLFPWDRLYNDLLYPPLNINIGTSLQGFSYNGISYGPVRELCNSLGKQVQWDAGTNTVLVEGYTGTIYGATSYVKIAVGSQLIEALIINDKSYAPVRKLAEALGHNVSWDAVNNTVIVV